MSVFINLSQDTEKVKLDRCHITTILIYNYFELNHCDNEDEIVVHLQICEIIAHGFGVYQSTTPC